MLIEVSLLYLGRHTALHYGTPSGSTEGSLHGLKPGEAKFSLMMKAQTLWL